jgi:hypothetical protein
MENESSVKKIKYVLILVIGGMLYCVLAGLVIAEGVYINLQDFRLLTATISAMVATFLMVIFAEKTLRGFKGLVIVYFFVLFFSYLLSAFYLSFAVSFSWLLLLIVANFFVGYFVRDVYEATKIVVVCSLLFMGITLGLLNVSYVYEAFPQHGQMLPEDLTIGYFILIIFLGIAVSFVGTMFCPVVYEKQREN